MLELKSLISIETIYNLAERSREGKKSALKQHKTSFVSESDFRNKLKQNILVVANCLFMTKFMHSGVTTSPSLTKKKLLEEVTPLLATGKQLYTDAVALLQISEQRHHTPLNHKMNWKTRLLLITGLLSGATQAQADNPSTGIGRSTSNTDNVFPLYPLSGVVSFRESHIFSKPEQGSLQRTTASQKRSKRLSEVLTLSVAEASFEKGIAKLNQQMNSHHRKKRDNSKMVYIYTDKQDPICHNISFKLKCKNLHQTAFNNGKIHTKLILKRGNIDCYCPPPDAGTFNIVAPPVPYLFYVYTPRQPEICKTEHIINRCSHSHQNSAKKGIIFNLLTLQKEGKRCLCPPARQNLLPVISPLGILLMKKNITHSLPIASPMVQEQTKKTTSNEYNITIIPDAFPDVKIEKIFDFSCVKERNSEKNATQIMRLISEILTDPVDKMIKEWQVVYNYEIKKTAAR